MSGKLLSKTLVLFGTRPEIIKLAPVIHKLIERNFPTVIVSSGQHSNLLTPFLQTLNIVTDYDLNVMTANQTPNQVLAKTLSELDVIIEKEEPELLLVQGDTTTTLAGALAGFNRKISVGHVEAGLRSGNLCSPFPEEMNRRLISQIASFHFCATGNNRQNLLAENVAENKIFLTGNTVVDSLNFFLNNLNPSETIKNILKKTENLKRILLTTHRRESFGAKMSENLLELKRFVERHTDTCLIFPVHPNPSVRQTTLEILTDRDRLFILEPLDYIDFIALMKSSWLIVSDSGGVQEEAPSLGKPLFVLRENTERPEALESGIAKLVGGNSLTEMLEEHFADDSWINSVKKIKNPFGDGKSAERIVEIINQNPLDQ